MSDVIWYNAETGEEVTVDDNAVWLDDESVHLMVGFAAGVMALCAVPAVGAICAATWGARRVRRVLPF